MSLELSLVAKCNARFIKKSASQKVIYAQTSFRLDRLGGGGGGRGGGDSDPPPGSATDNYYVLMK